MPRIKTTAKKGKGGHSPTLPSVAQSSSRRRPRAQRSPSPSASRAPSPLPPPPTPSWVLRRLKELTEGHLKIYYERGFLLQEAHSVYKDLYVTPCVRHWGWEQFVEQPTLEVPVRLVHDFVANFPDEENPTSVLVRGVEVDISPEAIRRVYGFNYELGEYDFFTKTLNDTHLTSVHSTIAERLCGDKTAQWDTGEVLTCNITKQAQIWAKFVRSRLIPKQHGHKLSKAVAVAAYCIIAALPFHPPKILYTELCSNSKRTQGPFYLPCLVKLLCDAAAVPSRPEDTELVSPPKSGFDKACLRRICEAGNP